MQFVTDLQKLILPSCVKKSGLVSGTVLMYWVTSNAEHVYMKHLKGQSLCTFIYRLQLVVSILRNLLVCLIQVPSGFLVDLAPGMNLSEFRSGLIFQVIYSPIAPRVWTGAFPFEVVWCHCAAIQDNQDFRVKLAQRLSSPSVYKGHGISHQLTAKCPTLLVSLPQWSSNLCTGGWLICALPEHYRNRSVRTRQLSSTLSSIDATDIKY